VNVSSVFDILTEQVMSRVGNELKNKMSNKNMSLDN